MNYLFLDESGDLGFNPKKKNSKFFIITVIFTSEKKSLEKIVKKTHATLRKKVKRLSGGVLHSYKENAVTRNRLLKLVSGGNYKIMTVCLNKSKVHTNLQDEKHVLYNYVVNILLDRIMTKKYLQGSGQVVLIAEKRETNKFLNDNFKAYLENQLKNKHRALISVEIKIPSQEKALQAIDFVSWSIFRKYEMKDDSYYKIIKDIIVEENPLFP